MGRVVLAAGHRAVGGDEGARVWVHAKREMGALVRRPWRWGSRLAPGCGGVCSRPDW